MSAPTEVVTTAGPNDATTGPTGSTDGTTSPTDVTDEPTGPTDATGAVTTDVTVGPPTGLIYCSYITSRNVDIVWIE